MITPPFLVGSAILFWGWQTGLLWLAIPAAALIEGSRWVTGRLDLEPDHYNRLWNLTFLLVLGVAIFLFFSQGGYAAVSDAMGQVQPGVRTDSLKSLGSIMLRVVQLLPAPFLLFILAFVYGPLKELPASVFSLIIVPGSRRPSGRWSKVALVRVNPVHGFLVLLLLAVAASNDNPAWYFPCVAGLILWTVWSRRTSGYRPQAWVAAVLVAGGLGWGTKVGLLFLQKQLELLQNQWINHLGNAPEFDTSQTRTSMGDIGRLKLSGRIVWRVHADQSGPPTLLQEAVFNNYDQPRTPGLDGRPAPPAWTSNPLRRHFELSGNGARDPEYVFNSRAAPSRVVTLTGYTRYGEVNIPHPADIISIKDLTAKIVTIETNAMGSMRAIGAEPLAVLEGHFGPTGGFSVGPYEDDKSLADLAPADTRALEIIARQLKLKSSPPAEALRRIQLFFFNNFDYTLDLKPPPAGSTNDTPLSYFLLDRRKGHCEYFATATTLLLREAGIPARYAVGYSVQEKKSGNDYVVRDRHAHAWALAWIDNHWREVDNTPAGWFEAEWADASPWEAELDWWSDAWLAFYRWRQGDTNPRLYILVASVLALGYLAWRQVAGKHWRRMRKPRPGAAATWRLGSDSEFRLIQQALEKSVPRDEAEPVTLWLEKHVFRQTEMAAELTGLLELHYRLRFDPAGLPPAERQQLARESTRWLEAYNARQKAGTPKKK